MSKKIAGRVFLAVLLSYAVLTVLVLFIKSSVKPGMAGLMLISEGIIVLPAIVAYILIARKVSFADTFGFRKIRISTIFAVIGFGLLIMPLGTLMNAISMLVVKNVFAESASLMLGLSFPVTFLIIAVYGPLCEELTFRGIILKSLDYENTGWKAIVISGLAFGLMHMNLNQFMYAFVMGMAFALVVEATGSIWSSIICHCLFNGINVLGLYLVDKFVPGYYESEAVKAAASQDTILMSIGIYLNIASVTTVLAMFLLKWIANREGNPDYFKKLKGNGQKALTPIMVLTIILYVVYIAGDTYVSLTK